MWGHKQEVRKDAAWIWLSACQAKNSQQNWTLLAPWWVSSLQNCEQINVWHLTHPVCSICHCSLSRLRQVPTSRDIGLKNAKISSFLILWSELLAGEFSLNLSDTWSWLNSSVQGTRQHVSEQGLFMIRVYRIMGSFPKVRCEDADALSLLKILVWVDKSNWKRPLFLC